MIIYNDLYTINYTIGDISYIENVASIIDKKINEYIKFFNLESLPKKIIINFYDDIGKFRDTLTSKYGHCKDTTCAKANENVIDILSYQERIKVKGRQDDTIDTLFMTICHELVHICHIAYKGNSHGTWFSEALAINLGSPRYELTYCDCTAQDLLKRQAKSKHYYTLGRYMLDNYSHEKILEYAKDDDKLIRDTKTILEDTNNYYFKNN